jgi:hypothetical protein
MKSIRLISIAIIVTFAYMVLFFTPVRAAELKRPNVNKTFSREKESKIQALRSRKTKQAFDGLKDVGFLTNRDLTYKAIHTAFNDRRAEALSLAKSYLKLPIREYFGGKRITRVRDFNIAKKIFEVFPDEATPILTTLYNSSNSITRGNIIRASGGVSGGQQIKNMLIKALDDKSFAEDETPEMTGEPLRVCDVAYNQLVLRYKVMNVLRTITEAHDIETRDHHINILKGLL